MTTNRNERLKILALIPARGGSKGVPRKNIKPLHGKPLIAYSISTGLECSAISDVVVSTDDDEIAQIARDYGALVPFLRPSALATDDSPSIDTIVHALRFFEEAGTAYDALCLLQPTVPYRAGVDVDAAISTFKNSDADCLISVREVPHVYNPYWTFEEEGNTGMLRRVVKTPDLITRRQQLPPAYHRDGSIYITRTNVILEQHSLYGTTIAYHQMMASPDVNIDTMADWNKAQNINPAIYHNHNEQ